MKEERIALCHHDSKSRGKTVDPPNKEDATETDKREEKKGSSRLLLGYLSGVIMALSFAASTSCSQALGGSVPAFQLNTFRFFGQLFYTVPAVLVRRPSLPKDKKQLLLNETSDEREVWNLNNSTAPAQLNGTTGNDTIHNQTKGILLLLAYSIGSFLGNQIRYRFLQDVDIFALLFWISLCGTLFSAVVMLIAETPTFPTTAQCVALLFGHSVSAVSCATLIVVASLIVPPVPFSLLISLKLAFFLVAQYTALRHVNPGHRNPVEVAGGVLVFCASMLRPIIAVYKQWIKTPEQE